MWNSKWISLYIIRREWGLKQAGANQRSLNLMMKKIGLVVASVAAVGIIFAGAMTYACDKNTKSAKTASTQSAEAKSCCPGAGTKGAVMTSGDHCASKGASVQTASDGSQVGKSCGSKAMAGGSCATKGTAGAALTSGDACATKSSMAGGKMCGTKTATAGHACCPSDKKAAGAKAAYAANVYEVRDGRKYAVAQGKTFEVTATTPYYEVGSARYYFSDAESMSKCSEKMASMAAEIDKETVSLATAEGNVVTNENGQKLAVCPVSDDKFVITASTPAKVVDGQKYYVCSERCDHAFLQTAVLTDQQKAQ